MREKGKKRVDHQMVTTKNTEGKTAKSGSQVRRQKQGWGKTNWWKGRPQGRR